MHTEARANQLNQNNMGNLIFSLGMILYCIWDTLYYSKSDKVLKANSARYTHKAKYHGIPVWYDQYEEGDDWIKGENALSHFTVQILVINDVMIRGKEVEVYDAEPI